MRNSNISEKKAKKVINIEFMNEEEFLVNTNDSRIRRFRLSRHNGELMFQSAKIELKYKGHKNAKYPLRMSQNK